MHGKANGHLPSRSFCKGALRFLTSGFRFQAGFTLVELAMVTLIGGIIMATSGTAMHSFLKQTRVDATRVRMEGIENALRQYLAANNKYPCPAALNAVQNDAAYGTEVDLNCAGPPPVAGETFRVRGRDVDGAGPGAPQVIRVGAVPVRHLNLPDTYTTDGWGNRFWFVVTEELASPPPPVPGTFASSRGGIAIFDGVPTNTPNLVTDTAQYAIISAGPNRLGAFNMDGIQAIPCPPELPATGGTVEASNCTFVDPPGPNTPPKKFRASLNTATATGASTYDDYVAFRTSADAGNSICQKQGLAYNPTDPGADADGCTHAKGTISGICLSGWNGMDNPRGFFEAPAFFDSTIVPCPSPICPTCPPLPCRVGCNCPAGYQAFATGTCDFGDCQHLPNGSATGEMYFVSCLKL